jgi:6-phosphogluconate dehydrogenase
MQLGMIGLGRIGANIVRRAMRDGHEAVVYDVSPEAVTELEREGASGTSSLDEFVEQLEPPRIAWILIPAGLTGKVVDELAERLEAGDIIIDGGNTYYRDDIGRAQELGKRGIHYVDVGTSGGVFGLERGFCLMIGGEKDVVRHLDPLLKTIAPGVETAPRTPGRNGKDTTAEDGYLHCGPAGAGHFVKMVHNGIEYGIMAAYAEGLNVLHRANVGKAEQEVDAETAPLQDPEYYQFDFEVPEIAELWRRGTVITSWLLDLTAEALAESPELDGFGGHVSDSGEGRWTIRAAIDEGVPVPVLSASLYERFTSRGEAMYADRLLSAMRKQFGGHAEKVAAGT